MADPVVGGVTVEIKGDPTKFDAALAGSEQKARAFDANVSGAMTGPTKAFEALSATQQKLVSELAKSGAAAKDVAAAFGKTADSAKMMAAYQELTASSSQKATSAAKQLAGALESEADRAAKLRAALDPLSGAKKKFSEATAEANALLKAGAITQGEHTAALKLAQGEMGKAEKALQHVAGATSTVTRETLVLAREGSRGNFNRMAGSATILAGALGLMTPAVIATTAAVTLGVVAIAAAVVATAQYEEEQKKLTATTIGLGAVSGMTAKQLEDSGMAAARASGMTIQASTASAQAFAAAGVRSQEVITDLSSEVETFAELTGTKAADAQKTLASAMADPVKGAQELHNSLGILDGDQLKQIQNLVAMGDKEKAVEIITHALDVRFGEAHAAGIGLGGELNALKLGFSFLWQEIAKANDQLNLFTAFGFASGGIQKRAADQKAAAGRAAARTAQLNTDSAGANDVLDDTPEGRFASQQADLQGRLGRLQKAQAADQALGNTDRVKREAQSIREVTEALHSLLPAEEQHHREAQLDAQISQARAHHNKDLVASLTQQKALLQTAGQILSPEQRAQRAADAGLDAGARTGAGPHAKRDVAGDQLKAKAVDAAGELALADAYLESDAAAMKADATRRALTETTRAGRTEAQKAAMVEAELNLTIAKGAADAAKKVAGDEADVSAMRRTNDEIAAGTKTSAEANRELSQERELRPLVAALTLAEGDTKTKLTGIIERLKKAYVDLNAETQRTAVLSGTEGQGEANKRLELELSLLNSTNRARAVAIAQADAEAFLKRNNTSPNSPEGGAYISSKTAGANDNADLQSASFVKQRTDQVRAEAEAYAMDAKALGMSFEAADKYRFVTAALNEAAAKGIDLNDEQRAAIEKLGDAYAKTSTLARNLQHDQQAAAAAAGALADDFSTMFTSLLAGGKEAQDALHNLVKTLGSQSLQALLTGSGPLAGFFGTDKTKTPGGPNGGVLTSLFGNLMGQGTDHPSTVANLFGGVAGGKPKGTATDPLFVVSATGAGGGAGGPLGAIMGLLGGGGGAGGGEVPSDLVGLFHDGIDSVGDGGQRRMAPRALFANAPRLHSGLAPDEFPAILQRGEGVSRKGERGGNRTVHMHINGVTDTGAFRRSRAQMMRAAKRELA